MTLTGLYRANNVAPVRSPRARRLRATFDLEVPGLGTVTRCRVLEDDEGNLYVRGPSVQSSYEGWVHVVKLSAEAAKEALRAYHAAVAEDR